MLFKKKKNVREIDPDRLPVHIGVIINFNEVSTVRSLMNYLKILAREMEEPCCIKDIKTISKEEYFGAIPEMAAAALRDATTQTNPRVPTQEEVEALYRDIWDFEVVDKY